MQLHKYQENWNLFESTQELLKREKFLYLNDAEDYGGLDPKTKKMTLVENIEALIS
jgi:hypothetical protein